MRITVFGASGRTGRRVVAQALERGDTVTAVARPASDLGPARDLLAVIRVHDLDHPDELAAAIADSDAVISAVGPRGRRDAPVAAPATRSILSALDAVGRRRLVVISAAPVDPPGAGDGVLGRYLILPLVGAVLRPVYDDLREMERMLANSHVPWTAFRPPQLTDGPATGRFRETIGRSVPGGRSLSRADLAQAMLDGIEREDLLNTPVGVAY